MLCSALLRFGCAALVAASLLSSLLGTPAAAADEKAAKAEGSLWVFIGTNTGPQSKGIYVSKLDLATGKLSPPELAAEAVNPNFLAIHPSGKFLYAVGEVTIDGKKRGGASAFAIDRATGKLTLLNQQSSVTGGPCHINVDKAGKNALVANYGGGSVAVLPINADGSLKLASSHIQHEGKSVNVSRQAGPHAHSVNLDAENRFAFVADLGLDKVLIYKFDSAAGKLEPNTPPAAEVKPGAGPRHFAFHPNGKLAFVINELHQTLTAFRYDGEKGVLSETDTQSTVPEPVPGNSTAEVVVHPSGKWVYGSNRGHDSIAIFGVNAETGKLTPLGHQKTGGKTPRNFALDPSGTFLLAENQGSGSIVVFRVDPATGKLSETGSTIQVGSPVCVRFLSAN